MAATLAQYPVAGDLIVRGDPLTIPVTIASTDVSDWTWRAYIRSRPDASTVVAEFAIDVDPDDSSTVLLQLTSEETGRLRNGMGFDLVQLTPVQRTWLTVSSLRVQSSYSWEEG